MYGIQIKPVFPNLYFVFSRSFFPVGNGPEFGTSYHSEEDRISADSSPSDIEEDEMENPFAFRRKPNVQVRDHRSFMTSLKPLLRDIIRECSLRPDSIKNLLEFLDERLCI